MVNIAKPWLSLYPAEIKSTIVYEKKPLFAFLQNAALHASNRKALHFFGKELTYQQVYEYSLRFANYLSSLGVKKRDRVAIMLPNCPQAVISYYAILLTGAIVVQVNPMYKERELSYLMKDSKSKCIICLDILYPTVLKIKPVTCLENIIVTGIEDYLPFPKNVLYPFQEKKKNGLLVQITESDTTHLFKKAIQQTDAKEINININPEEDLALLQYTGGTTGTPKGVKLTHFNLVSNTTMCKNWLYQCNEGKETILGILPFFHVFGMTVVMNFSVMSFSKMILVPKFEPKSVLTTIEKQRPTILPGAPTIYLALLNHPDLKKYDLSSIHSCISGSAPLPKEIQEQFEEITGGKLVEGYGLTEASPVTHANFLWKKNVKGSIGVPWPDTESFILSLKTKEPAEINEIGEIVVRGPQVMKGYWNKPEETKASFLKDDWLLTGDLGYMDEKGYFYIVDRKKDIIIAGGFNIYPREIEEVLYDHEKIQEAVVVGVPDSKLLLF